MIYEIIFFRNNCSKCFIISCTGRLVTDWFIDKSSQTLRNLGVAWVPSFFSFQCDSGACGLHILSRTNSLSRRIDKSYWTNRKCYPVPHIIMCSGKPKSYCVYRNWSNKCDWGAVSSKKKNAEFEVSLLFMKIEFKDYITYYFFYLLK